MGGGCRTQIFPLFIPSVGANTEPPSQEEGQRQREKNKLLSHKEEERGGENMGEENTLFMFSVARSIKLKRCAPRWKSHLHLKD